MGWGTKKGAAAPQPVKPRTVTKSPLLAAPYGTEPEQLVATSVKDHEQAVADDVTREKPSEAAKAMLAWHQLKSQKGWTDATVAMLLHEFIESRGLFADLVKFMKKR